LTTSPDFDPPQPSAPPPTDTTVGQAPEQTVVEPTAYEPPTASPARPASVVVDEPTTLIARPASPLEQQITFVPLAVSVGDGFKFGCGFFLALVLAMLIGFVLLAALFVLTSLFGLNLPISR
jgi:hypothetical protein